MKSPILLVLLATIALMATLLPQLHATTTTTEEEDHSNELPWPKSGEDPSQFFRPMGRFLADKPRGIMTCDQYPTVCRAKGSPGPDCCYRRCVNVLMDRLNCGKCGRRCKYSEICCQGLCVNPSVNEKHCGRCYNKCKKGSSCAYGLCRYA